MSFGEPTWTRVCGSLACSVTTAASIASTRACCASGGPGFMARSGRRSSGPRPERAGASHKRIRLRRSGGRGASYWGDRRWADPAPPLDGGPKTPTGLGRAKLGQADGPVCPAARHSSERNASLAEGVDLGILTAGPGTQFCRWTATPASRHWPPTARSRWRPADLMQGASSTTCTRRALRRDGGAGPHW